MIANKFCKKLVTFCFWLRKFFTVKNRCLMLGTRLNAMHTRLGRCWQHQFAEKNHRIANVRRRAGRVACGRRAGSFFSPPGNIGQNVECRKSPCPRQSGLRAIPSPPADAPPGRCAPAGYDHRWCTGVPDETVFPTCGATGRRPAQRPGPSDFPARGPGRIARPGPPGYRTQQ